MTIGIARRQFISALGGATLAWPLAARAQQGTMPVIGFLHQGSAEQNVERLSVYRKSLGETGFVEGQNVAIEFRWAAGQFDKLPAMLADLIHRQVAVIVTPFSTQAALEAKAATSTIPIVFVTAGNPIELGLVASLNRPGGNVTGVTSLNTELASKRLELLRKLVPQAARYFTLVNPKLELAEPFIKDFQAGATSRGVHFDVLRASTDREIEAAFASIPKPNSVLVCSTDAFFYIRRSQIAALAIRYAVPAIFDARDYAEAGGLLSYGANSEDLMRIAGSYTRPDCQR